MHRHVLAARTNHLRRLDSECLEILEKSRNLNSFASLTQSISSYRCQRDTTLDYSYDPTRSFQQLKIKTFRFFNDYDTVFIHCELFACHKNSPNSRLVLTILRRYYLESWLAEFKRSQNKHITFILPQGLSSISFSPGLTFFCSLSSMLRFWKLCLISRFEKLNSWIEDIEQSWQSTISQMQ